MIADQTNDTHQPHIMRLVASRPIEAPQFDASAKALELLETACEEGGLQLSEVGITLMPGADEAEPVEDEAQDEEDTSEIREVPRCNVLALTDGTGETMGLFEIGNDAVFLAMAALLGSQPDSEPFIAERPLSMAEWAFVSIIGEDLRSLLVAIGLEAASSYTIEPLHKGPNDSQREAVTPDAEFPVALQWGEHKAVLTIRLPRRAVEALFQEPASATAAPNSWGNRLKRSVGKAPIRVSAVMAMGSRTLGQIQQLSAGDILDLNPAGDAQRIYLTANGQTLFTAELGRVGKVYSARIITRHAHQADAGALPMAK